MSQSLCHYVTTMNDYDYDYVNRFALPQNQPGRELLDWIGLCPCSGRDCHFLRSETIEYHIRTNCHCPVCLPPRKTQNVSQGFGPNIGEEWIYVVATCGALLRNLGAKIAYVGLDSGGKQAQPKLVGVGLRSILGLCCGSLIPFLG